MICTLNLNREGEIKAHMWDFKQQSEALDSLSVLNGSL